MEDLLLNDEQMSILDKIVLNLEEKFGKDYSYQPEHNEFQCKCSGPAQSCVWH